MGQLHPQQLVLLGLLTAVGIVALIARKTSISYPILLVIAGLIFSLVPHVPRVALPPNLVFFGLLPPLLYAAAWQTSWREFHYHLVTIVMLAVGLVLFTAVGVALTAHWFMPGFDWRLGFLLGAIVSPTDAVAATSIARRVGMPHAIVDILEGESLLNDATGLLALQFGIEMIVDGAVPAPGRAALEFVWLLGGGIGIGLAVGWVAQKLEHFVDEGPVEIAFSIVIAYASYLTGEVLHASGVLATVFCGLYLSRKRSQIFSPGARLQTLAVWGALEFLLNGLVFLLIGLQLPYATAAIQQYNLLHLILYGLGFAVVLIALRLIWVYPGVTFAAFLRRRVLRQDYDAPGRKGKFVLGWTGMRGVIALGGASALPLTIADGKPLPQRELIMFLTFSVILVTLVLQGLSLPAVVRAMDFKTDLQPQCEEDEARRLLLQRAVTFLKQQKDAHPDTGNPVYEAMLHRYEYRQQELARAHDQPSALGTDEETQPIVTSRSLLVAVFQQQREELNDLRSSGKIGDGAYRTLERELDLGETRLSPGT